MEERIAGPAVPGRRLELAGNGEPQIDGRLRQNPAYRPAREPWPLTVQMLAAAFYIADKLSQCLKLNYAYKTMFLSQYMCDLPLTCTK